jgi:hypothetical protein
VGVGEDYLGVIRRSAGRGEECGPHESQRLATQKRFQLALSLDQRLRQASSGAIEEDSHAESLGALCSDEAHVATDVIDVVKVLQLRFVKCGIPFKARDPLFDRLTETRADLETILSAAMNSHEGTSDRKNV